jgi:hypothetical protein
VEKQLREELAKLQVEVNEEKSRKVDLEQGESLGLLGFEFRRIRNRRGRWMAGVAFILGAGTSSEAGAPLMKNFVNVARDNFQNRQGRINSVFAAMAALARSQAKATLDLQNIEEVFSAFELGSLVQRLGNLPEEIIKDLPSAIRELIARTLEDQIRYELIRKRSDSIPSVGVHFRPDRSHTLFATLIASLTEAGHDISVLTFNYDVSLEAALDHLLAPGLESLALRGPSPLALARPILETHAPQDRAGSGLRAHLWHQIVGAPT